MSADNGSRAAEMTLAFVFGAVAGAALALLFAPVPGREARVYLGQKAREGQDKAAALAQDAWARTRERTRKETT